MSDCDTRGECLTYNTNNAQWTNTSMSDCDTRSGCFRHTIPTMYNGQIHPCQTVIQEVSVSDIQYQQYIMDKYTRRPQWLSWMRRPTGDQEVVGSTLAEVGNILSWRLIMKYSLPSFSPFRWFKKGSYQDLAKECAQFWLTASRTKPAQ